MTVQRIANAEPAGGPQIMPEEWPLETSWLSWVLVEGAARGLSVRAIMGRDGQGWSPCAPRDVVGSAEGEVFAWVTQRTSCTGLVSAILLTDQAGVRGGWFVDRGVGAPEPGSWRALLLEALILSNGGRC